MSQRWFCLVPSLLVACSCESSAGTGTPPPETSQSYAGPAPTADTSYVKPAPGTVESSPGAGQTVAEVASAGTGAALLVTGLYLGWKGPCVGEPPTRSAWQLAQDVTPGSPCVYVDGALLSGVPPEAAQGNIRVRVQGILRVDGNLRFIEARSVERL